MRMFLHLGVHKTGSTFMQQSFFPNLGGISYCHCRTQCRDFLKYILHADDLEFVPRRARELFDGAVAVGGASRVVLSDEMFYAPLMWSRYAHRRRGCHRLAQVFPDSHAVIVLRNQRTLLESLYREFVSTGGTSSWAAFLENRVAPGYLHFGSYVAYLRNLFGPSNVTVFFYEDFVSNSECYLDKWCELFGIPRDGWNREISTQRDNPSISPRLLPVLRVANRFISSKRHPESILPRSLHGSLRTILLKCSPLFGKAKAPWYPCDEMLEKLLDECREGNREIAKLVGRDLEGLGYPC